MWTQVRSRGAFASSFPAILLVCAIASPVRAGDWTLLLEPTLMDAGYISMCEYPRG
jgi:hypothetical protein